jgi:anti-sigma factor RsiW
MPDTSPNCTSPECNSIDPLITPYIDGDIGAHDRRLVDDHVRACPPCHSRVAAEQAIRELMRTKRTELVGVIASVALRDRCAALQRQRASVAGVPAGAGVGKGLRTRLVPLALAAGVVAVVGAASVYQLTDRSSRLLAAELTADHVKCFGMNSLIGANADPAAAEGAMVSAFGWHMPVEKAGGWPGMELVGARVCLYGRGRAAHIMYRHNGQPVSVYMIPKMTRSDALVDIMGHEAAIWSDGGRTFVLVAREPEVPGDDLTHMTAFVRAALH